MAIDATYIEDNSPFVLGTHFSQEQFNRWLSVAADQVVADDPGWSSAQKDEATCLLICHRIERRLGKLGKQSESIGGDYSWSRRDSSQLSHWLAEYDDLKVRGGGGRDPGGIIPSSGVRRGDAEVSDVFRLDDNPAPTLDVTDPTITGMRRYP